MISLFHEVIAKACEMLYGAFHALVDIIASRDRAVHQDSIIIVIQLVEHKGRRAIQTVRIPIAFHLAPEVIGVIGKVAIGGRSNGIIVRLIGTLCLLHPDIVRVLPAYTERAVVIVAGVVRSLNRQASTLRRRDLNICKALEQVTGTEIGVPQRLLPGKRTRRNGISIEK